MNDVDKTTPRLCDGVTSTPNGDLHLGHLSGPYPGADVLTRYVLL